MPEDDPLIADSLTVYRVRDALTGGKRGLGRERDVAAYLEQRFPGIGRAVTAAHDFHRRAALWAVTGGELAPPAEAVIFAACGLPAPSGPLHADALEAAPHVRILYCDSNPKITEVNVDALVRPDPERVMAETAWRPLPEVLGTPQARELTRLGPVSVQLMHALHWWPPPIAREAVAGYGRRLPPGSTLCMSLWTPERDTDGKVTPEGEEMMEVMTLAGGRAYTHSAQDVAEWVMAAGMRLHPMGVTDAREFGRPAPKAPLAGLPGRVIEAVGIVP